MRKPAIPRAPLSGDDRSRFDAAVKENLEIITGQRGRRIEPLPAGATTEEIAAKVNEILLRIQ